MDHRKFGAADQSHGHGLIAGVGNGQPPLNSEMVVNLFKMPPHQFVNPRFQVSPARIVVNEEC